MKENLMMLEVERQMVVDRERKTLEALKPFTGEGWTFVDRRLEIAELKLIHVKRRQHGLNYCNTSTGH